MERPGAFGRNVGLRVGLVARQCAGGEAGGGLVVGVEVRLEALTDRGGEAALELVAEEVDLVGPVGAWCFGLRTAELQEVDDDLLEQ